MLEDNDREYLLELAKYNAQELSSHLGGILERLLISSNQIVDNNHKQFFNLINLTTCLVRAANAEFMYRHLYNNDKYKNSKRIAHFGESYFSMGTEDGIIREIFRRIGTTNRKFVEIGCNPDGLQNNTLYLLLNRWQGLWIEMSSQILESARQKFAPYISRHDLTILNEQVDWENVNRLIQAGGVTGEIDLFSLDIDSWEYFVWEALDVISPRAVVVEYQSLFGPDIACTIPKDKSFEFKGSYYCGASLKALENLGREKGYALVGCDFSGTNAFFVRTDLVGDLFEAPFTTENHYEPNRTFLYQNAGSGLDFGEFTFV